MFGISDELFKEIYESGKYEDPHAELARRLGCERTEAKALVFHRLYSTPVTMDQLSEAYGGK